jgi:hypothetical protein
MAAALFAGLIFCKIRVSPIGGFFATDWTTFSFD